MLVPVSRMMNMASVELSGELMQEIHQIWYWKEFETNLYLVLMTVNGVFNFFYLLKAQGTNEHQVSSSFQHHVGVSHILKTLIWI